LRVNQAKAGKKIIGTASPGKSSGFLTIKRREIENRNYVIIPVLFELL
jgi:hypothetical protein